MKHFTLILFFALLGITHAQQGNHLVVQGYMEHLDTRVEPYEEALKKTVYYDIDFNKPEIDINKIKSKGIIYSNGSEKQDSQCNNNRIFIAFNGSSKIYGVKPLNTHYEFDGSVLYARDFEIFNIKSIQISPALGYGYSNYSYGAALYKQNRNLFSYGLNIANSIGAKGQLEYGFQGLLFNEMVKIISNQEIINYTINGFQVNMYLGANLKIKSNYICPFISISFIERQKYRYINEKTNILLNLGLQIKL